MNGRALLSLFFHSLFALGFLSFISCIDVPFLNAGQLINEQSGTWIRDGEEHSFPITFINATPYLTVAQVAKVARAQLRWQTISQEACIGRPQSELCFDWGRSRVSLDGRHVRTGNRFQYRDGELFVPLPFLASKDFQHFSGSHLSWDEKNRRLIENSPVTVQIPAVEKLNDRYRLCLEIKESTPYRVIDKSDRRIWLRFLHGRSEGSQTFEGDDVIREVKIHQRRHSVDLVLYLGKKSTFNELFFDSDGRKLIVDVFFSPASSLRPAVSSLPREPKQPQPSISARRGGATYNAVRGEVLDQVIVIDAGHGGMDSGAIGARGTFEKDINLKVAEALATQLKKEKGVRVIMTRTKDEFIPLSRRTDIANQANADLFVSIHCNSSLSSEHSGFEVYFLSSEATDKAAEAVARIENSVIALETKNAHGSSKLSQLLASMAVNNFINESSKCAALLCRSIKDHSSQNRFAVKEANFFVLRGAQMPGVLVELDYLSNPVSEFRLRSSRFRSQLVKGLAQGILYYGREINNQKKAIAAQLHQPSDDLDP